MCILFLEKSRKASQRRGLFTKGGSPFWKGRQDIPGVGTSEGRGSAGEHNGERRLERNLEGLCLSQDDMSGDQIRFDQEAGAGGTGWFGK
jgi:hypothetical protein